ncbi:hypothetical protein [Novosphingobium sp. BW1]|uniref:hypothetical protein n=1 Tax=Novosphingobium sp. BW1 TaxID=2592621 RepID=UPI0011DEA814|nr:hypothetical protein [Novosphingobium sp. BW1]TYC98014.1 hypothetical protein FMM79_00180 [Novosphingobium sp. BW1]
MADLDPNLVVSGLSGTVTQDGVTVDVNIVRLEDEPGWSLEVVNSSGTSTVWDDPFATDAAARDAFRQAVSEEGMACFLDSATVIPFPSR